MMRRALKRALQPLARALYWRIDVIVERIVAQRLTNAVQAALDDRMVALREELGPLENQAASTNAVLRGSARQAAALSERLTQVERKLAVLDPARPETAADPTAPTDTAAPRGQRTEAAIRFTAPR